MFSGSGADNAEPEKTQASLPSFIIWKFRVSGEQVLDLIRSYFLQSIVAILPGTYQHVEVEWLFIQVRTCIRPPPFHVKITTLISSRACESITVEIQQFTTL